MVDCAGSTPVTPTIVWVVIRNENHEDDEPILSSPANFRHNIIIESGRRGVWFISPFLENGARWFESSRSDSVMIKVGQGCL